MSPSLRSAWVAPMVLVAITASSGIADAADKSKVDRASRQVEEGAKRIGQGQIGPGFKQCFTGLGQTIVEGAKFSGANIKEFFTGKP
jgi:hypothetical protein